MEECSVCVAVKIRPLVQNETEQGCKSSLSVAPGTPQVSIKTAFVRITGEHLELFGFHLFFFRFSQGIMSSPMIMSLVVNVALVPIRCIPNVLLPWWMASSGATMPQCLPMARQVRRMGHHMMPLLKICMLLLGAWFA